jgi:hypothetical protein
MNLANKPEMPDGVGTLLLGHRPFTPAELDRLDAVCREKGFEVVLSSRVAADETFNRLTSGADFAAVVREYPINISPPTDDSPFFFNQLRMANLLNLKLQDYGKQSHNMRAVFVLGVLLLIVLVLTALCIVLPLAWTTERGQLHGRGPLLGFFAAIGLGFLLIETSQMQRLIIVLGHPTYGLTVVLFSLLLSSGIGSYLTAGVTAARWRAAALRLVALIAVLVVFGALTTSVGSSVEGSTTPVRIAVAIALLFPPGFLMGMAFPLGMKVAAADAPHLTPWLWGINGATSVLASVLSVVIALTWSISTAFWTGVACYVIATALFVQAARHRTTQAAE